MITHSRETTQALSLARLEHETGFLFSRNEYGVETSKDQLMGGSIREREQLLRAILDSIKVREIEKCSDADGAGEIIDYSG